MGITRRPAAAGVKQPGLEQELAGTLAGGLGERAVFQLGQQRVMQLLPDPGFLPVPQQGWLSYPQSS